MMEATPLDERKQQILKAVVSDYTVTGVPVGSQVLAAKYFIALSSATIRNELADLVGTGYLQQPHTSAGRVPTDRGYRYFVDFLMDPEAVSPTVRRTVKQAFEAAPHSVEGILEKAAMVLAQVTENVSLVTAPESSEARIKHIDLVSLESQSVVLHDGVRNLLRHPEFVEVNRLEELLELLEQGAQLAGILQQVAFDKDVEIIIGRENTSSGLRECSLVLTTYKMDERVRGTIGVIGPTRMHYGQVVARVRLVSQATSELLGPLGN